MNNWKVYYGTHTARDNCSLEIDNIISMLYGVSPLTMELFPYNYRSSTTIPWKTNKPITGFYILVRMSNRFSYMLLWVKPEEWVVSLLCCGLQWVTAQNHIPSEECTGTSASLQNKAFNLQQTRSQCHIHRMKEEEHIEGWEPEGRKWHFWWNGDIYIKWKLSMSSFYWQKYCHPWVY